MRNLMMILSCVSNSYGMLSKPLYDGPDSSAKKSTAKKTTPAKRSDSKDVVDLSAALGAIVIDGPVSVSTPTPGASGAGSSSLSAPALSEVDWKRIERIRKFSTAYQGAAMFPIAEATTFFNSQATSVVTAAREGKDAKALLTMTAFNIPVVAKQLTKAPDVTKVPDLVPMLTEVGVELKPATEEQQRELMDIWLKKFYTPVNRHFEESSAVNVEFIEMQAAALKIALDSYWQEQNSRLFAPTMGEICRTM